MKQNLLRHMFVLVLAIIASTGLLWADCYVEVVHDTIVKADTVVKIDTSYISIVDTFYTDCKHKDVFSSTHKSELFFIDFLLPLGISVLGAFIALLMTYRFLRPRFSIEPIAAKSLNNRVWFLVRNKSLITKVYSIKAELAYWKNDDNKKDIIYDTIDMDADDSLSILYPRWKCGVRKEDKYYVFHTRYPLIKKEDTTGIRLRISAYNAISNVFDAEDAKYVYDKDIRWGEFISDKFVPVKDSYSGENLTKVEVLERDSETISILFCKFDDKPTFQGKQQEWKRATELLGKLKEEEYTQIFDALVDVKPAITDMRAKVTCLENLYNGAVVYTPRVCDRRDKLIKDIMRDYTLISLYMEKSLI